MFISLEEAASLLDVTKETLRNWDKSGKLKSSRDPKNNYRQYLLSEVQALIPASFLNIVQRAQSKTALPLGGEKVQDADSLERNLKRALARVHKVLRDIDGSSSLVERFDEVTKLIFLKLLSEQEKGYVFSPQLEESANSYAARLRRDFQEQAHARSKLFPERFSHLKLSDEALVASANVLSEVVLSSAQHDLKGLAYEEMIRGTFDKGDHQQFFTPQTIVEFVVALMGDKLKGQVCDPAVGTGGFLVEVAKKKGLLPLRLLGLEIDDRLAWVAGINLLIHGAGDFQTRCLSSGGTLGPDGAALRGTIDAIITNPPFGSDFNDKKELESYILGKGRTSRRRGVLFIERCLEMLKTGGYLGIVIDEGVLSLPSSADVRELLFSQANLLAVISLPDSAFLPYASVATSVLLLRKTKQPSKEQLTFYARAENVGRKLNGDPDFDYDEFGVPELNNDLLPILESWRHFEKKGTLSGQIDNVYLARPQALISAEPGSDNRLDFRFHHPARLAAENALNSCQYQLSTIGDLCIIRNESFVPSIDFPDQQIPYTGLAHIESRVGVSHQVMVAGNSLKSNVKKYFKGDILFAKMRPALRKVALIDFDEPGFASAECVVITVRKNSKDEPLIDPFMLSVLLRSNYVFGQIIHLIAGIGRPRISLKDLLKIKIPVQSKKHQLTARENFLKMREDYESLRTESRRLAAAAASAELDAIEGVARSFYGVKKKI